MRVRIRFGQEHYIHTPTNRLVRSFVGEFDPATGLVAVEAAGEGDSERPEGGYAVHVASGTVVEYIREAAVEPEPARAPAQEIEKPRLRPDVTDDPAFTVVTECRDRLDDGSMSMRVAVDYLREAAPHLADQAKDLLAGYGRPEVSAPPVERKRGRGRRAEV